MQTAGSDNRDLHLILALFKKVRSQSERKFIHGRYFDPSVIRYKANYVDDQGASNGESKTATFFMVPYFSSGTLYFPP